MDNHYFDPLYFVEPGTIDPAGEDCRWFIEGRIIEGPDGEAERFALYRCMNVIYHKPPGAEDFTRVIGGEGSLFILIAIPLDLDVPPGADDD